MIENCQLVALEEALDGYRLRLKESDERKLFFVFGPHQLMVRHDEQLVSDGKLSPREAEQRRLRSVINALRRAERLRISNEHRMIGLAQVFATYRRARAEELRDSFATPN